MSNQSVVARRVELPPDPVELMRRLGSRSYPCMLWSADGSGNSYVTCDPIATSSALDPEPELELAPARASRWLSAPRWIGILPYESERLRCEGSSMASEARAEPLVASRVWCRYPAVAVVGRHVTLVGDDEQAVANLWRALREHPPGAVPAVEVTGVEVESPELHRHRIRVALEHILSGDIYQVNLARRLRLRTDASSVALLLQMTRQVRAPFAAALELPGHIGVACTSPELLLQTTRGGRAITIPIKGTRPRGSNAAEARRWKADLATDGKEHAELAMIIDVERNDLGRVSVAGSVQAETPVIVARSTVYHREALVSARLEPGLTRQALLEAMLPSGSVTGAPKLRAMEVIADLESERRGLYTGGLGYLAHDGSLKLAMAIRCLVTRRGWADYHVGGGIVAESDPEREVKETLWKAVQVQQWLGAAGQS